MKANFIFILLCLLLTTAGGFATTHYVDPNSTSPITPFTSWAHAATNIQSAIDAGATFSGDTILVTNGIYQTGGTSSFGFGASNRVYVSKTVSVQSVNGPGVTVICGYQMPGVTNGSSAIRCVYLTDGSSLSGFTLTNGATSATGNAGGVYCGGSSTVIVSNCVITGNSAKSDGGGAYQGTFYNCVFSGNTTFGSLGGGAAIYAGLNNCLLVSNTSAAFGGGAYNGTLRNCTCAGNYAGAGGGGAYNGTLRNCTCAGNYAGAGGGGAYGGTLYNSILYFNAIGANLPYGTNGYNVGIYNCCVAATNGLGLLNAGNFTNAPFFADAADGNFRLQAGSPCINAGINTNAPAGFDLDGNNRIAGGTVDIGAFEFQSQVTNTFAAWLQQYGLPTDGSATSVDSDGDGMNNAQEWIAGTNPTNAFSLLQFTSITATNNPSVIVVAWQSVPSRNYFLQRSTNLAAQPAFSTFQTNLAGLVGMTSFTDTTATNGSSFFYRVGVQ